MDDYVGDATQYPKWHVDRFRGMTPTKGRNVNGLCFFYLFISAARGQTAEPILTSKVSKCVFLEILHSLAVRTMISQFQGVKIPKNRQN